MKRALFLLTMLAAVATCAPRGAGADQVKATGLQGDVVANMMDAGTKVIELAEAIPEKKLAWSPGKGVRSAREVCLHVVAANYLIPNILGANTGKSMDEIMKIEKSTPTKAQIEKMLKESYEVATRAVAGVPDSDFETQVDFFGTKMSKRAMLLLLSAHSHEHLGQLIAYSRVNGIVPPWTARQLAAAKKAAAEKKTARAE